MRKDDQAHILVAEDEVHILGTLDFILKKEGFIVSTAANGRDALGIILEEKENANPVEILITDIAMPEMNGIELMAELKSAGVDLPVIVISGYQDRKTKDESLQLGCEDYILKPFTGNELLTFVKAALEKRGSYEHQTQK